LVNLNLGKGKKVRFNKGIRSNADDAEKKEKRRGSGSLPTKKVTPTIKNHEILRYNNRQKIIFVEHITKSPGKCRKVIFTLSRSA